MGSVAHYLEVDVPAEQAYAWWRGLTNLPTIMPDVESVEPAGGSADGGSSAGGSTELTHWKVHGPLGRTVEWDARITEDIPNTRIAWASVPGGDNDVSTTGAVRFDDLGGSTGIEVSLQYELPAGAAGEAVAKLFADPQDKVELALAAFKQTIEQGARTGT